MKTLAFVIGWLFIINALNSQSFLWTKHYTGQGQNAPQFAVTDNEGNTYVTGNFNGSITQDGYNFTTNGLQDMFLTKYDASGNVLWSIQLGGAGTENVYGLSLTNDQKSVYLGFTFNGTTNILGWTLDAVQNDVAVAKFTSSGDIENLFTAAEGESHQINGNLCVDRENNLYVLVNYTSIAKAGGETFYGNDYSSRQNLIVKFDEWGNYLWGKQIEGTSGLTYIRTITAKELDIYISGQFSGTLYFPNRGLL